jgi:hypothetical protein
MTAWWSARKRLADRQVELTCRFAPDDIPKGAINPDGEDGSREKLSA